MSELVFGVVSDVHFGPAAYFRGKLRKLTADAEPLLRGALEALRPSAPAFVVNLGDDLEDESREADLARYRRCLEVLGAGPAPVVHVAGNHDLVHLAPAELLAAWRDAPNVLAPCRAAERLFYSFDLGGFHFVVLWSQEEKDVRVSIDAEQLRWLEADLAATRLPVVVLVHHSLADQDLRGSRWFEGLPHICLIQERAAVRRVLEGADVRLVLNGHLHRSHCDVVGGIPYVTLQSLVENLDDDAPGRPARAFACVRLAAGGTLVEVGGAETYALQLVPARGALRNR